MTRLRIDDDKAGAKVHPRPRISDVERELVMHCAANFNYR